MWQHGLHEEEESGVIGKQCELAEYWNQYLFELQVAIGFLKVLMFKSINIIFQDADVNFEDTFNTAEYLR